MAVSSRTEGCACYSLLLFTNYIASAAAQDEAAEETSRRRKSRKGPWSMYAQSSIIVGNTGDSAKDKKIFRYCSLRFALSSAMILYLVQIISTYSLETGTES